MVAALTAAMMFAGQELAMVHFALVEHTVCAEHGELTHAPPSSTKADHDPAGFSSLEASGHGGDQHDECTILGRSREDARPDLQYGPAFNLALLSDASHRSRDVAPELTLGLAPKTSPPKA